MMVVFTRSAVFYRVGEGIEGVLVDDGVGGSAKFGEVVGGLVCDGDFEFVARLLG